MRLVLQQIADYVGCDEKTAVTVERAIDTRAMLDWSECTLSELQHAAQRVYHALKLDGAKQYDVLTNSPHHGLEWTCGIYASDVNGAIALAIAQAAPCVYVDYRAYVAFENQWHEVAA